MFDCCEDPDFVLNSCPGLFGFSIKISSVCEVLLHVFLLCVVKSELVFPVFVFSVSCVPWVFYCSSGFLFYFKGLFPSISCLFCISHHF